MLYRLLYLKLLSELLLSKMKHAVRASQKHMYRYSRRDTAANISIENRILFIVRLEIKKVLWSKTSDDSFEWIDVLYVSSDEVVLDWFRVACAVLEPVQRGRLTCLFLTGSRSKNTTEGLVSGGICSMNRCCWGSPTDRYACPLLCGGPELYCMLRLY